MAQVDVYQSSQFPARPVMVRFHRFPSQVVFQSTRTRRRTPLLRSFDIQCGLSLGSATSRRMLSLSVYRLLALVLII